MENLSHSRQPNKSSTTHSKKPCNGTNFMAKTTYDDVFGGPPKFGAPTLAPRVEDYSEIFGCFHSSRASSIPVLDLPVVDEEDVFFDVSSSGFDYNEVFGGYDVLDSAVSFEDLMMGRNDAVHADVDSSEEAWTPAETESFSEESDHSGKNKCLSNADSYESIDGTMEFNISYNKANQRNDGDMSNGITHVEELQAVPRFTFVVDRTTKLEKRYENPPVQVTDENNLHMDFGGGMMREKNLSKTMSQPSSSSAGEQPFENGIKPQRRYARNSSLPNETFVTVSEISLRTQPSEVPPPCRPAPLLDVKKGVSGRLVKNSKPSGSEGNGGYTSPPFFDVEVDASSSAAASAAAMKEAMEKAQVKLKTAKELLERKREGVQRRKSDKKDREGRLYGNVDGSSSVINERVHGTCGRQENGMKYSLREEKQKVMKMSKAVPDSLEGEKLFNMDEILVEKHRRPDKIDGAAEWIEETQFFELVRTDRSTFVQANSDEILVADSQIHEHSQTVKKGAMEAVECQQENCKKIKGNSEDHILGENEKKLKGPKEAWEQQESNGRSVASKATRKHKGHVKMSAVAQEVCEHGENEKNINVVRHLGDSEKKQTGSYELERHENLKKVHCSENLFEGEKAVRCLENELPLKETNGSNENLTRLEASHEQANNERGQGEASEQEQNEKKLKGAIDQVKVEEKLTEALKQRENVRKQVAHEREESEKGMPEAVEQTDNEKRLKEENQKQRRAAELGEYERRLKEVCEQKDNEKKQREGHEREDNEKKVREALDKEENDKKQKEASEKGEIEKRLKEFCEVELMEKKLKSASEAEDVKGTNMVQEQTRLDENGKKLKMAGEPHIYMEGDDLRVSNKECMLVDSRKVQATRLAGQQEENSRTVQITQRTFAHEENGKIQTENRDGEIELGAAEFMNVLVDRKFEPSGIAHSHSEHEAQKFAKKDVEELLSQEHIVGTRGESGTEIGSEKNESAFEIDSDTKTQRSKCDDEWGERESNIKHAHIGIHQKINNDKLMPTHLVKESVQIGRKMEADQPSELEGKGNIQRTAQRMSASQAEREENDVKVNLTLGEKEAERIKRERELEKERLRRIEEEKEREREREKDRMAVDKAFLEAREKAYTGARERAERSAVERVTADARQRALAEARERLEKAFAEVKEKSLAEKTSTEARLRAERAAVERATAEARERAVEKAMAERAAFEAREQGSFPEKFSAASRNSAMRPNDLQDHKFQSAGSSNCSRYPYSSGYGASYNTNRTEGVEGESAQRCKARLERHRRTAERAAKALAEKNMRDLLAQREQAERNRVAEALDADVKRWSSGKEGNLRALLSTLQYILGPDSGWHPIPLTEVITSAAVKKAYRKATLCVHPDKLQQRGASIQQKYICEKVFDLLKEAWNKFNSEER